MLEGAYQNEEVSFIHPIPEEELVDNLHDIDGGLEEVEPITLIGDDIVEEDKELEDEDEDEDGEEQKKKKMNMRNLIPQIHMKIQKITMMMIKEITLILIDGLYI